jgi:alkylation response protein AidB-like acyl-CoA dehydrogenase
MDPRLGSRTHPLPVYSSSGQGKSKMVRKAKFEDSSLKRLIQSGSTWDSADWQETPGISAPAIKNKLALRASITGSVFMEDVKIPHDALLPKSGGLGSPFSCLNNARYGISWGVMGALEDCIARSREYALER